MKSDFLFDDQFPVQNNEAHRHLPLPINAPAMTWHNGFWESKAGTVSEWRRAVDKVLKAHYDAALYAFKVVKSENVNKESIELFESDFIFAKKDFATVDSRRGNSVKFIIPFENSRLIILAEMFREFWTLCYVIELGGLMHEAGVGPKFAKTPRAIADMQKSFGCLIKNVNGNKCGSEHLPTFGFAEFIESHFGDVIRRKIIRHSEKDKPSFGHKFFDFKGIIIPCNPANTGQVDAGIHRAHGKLANHGEKREWELSNVWRTQGEPPSEAVRPNGRRHPTRNEWLMLVDKVWHPIVRRMHEARPKPEISVSTFQGDRSLYISSLGQRASEEMDIEKVSNKADEIRKSNTVKYLILVSHRSKFELGRLVYRLHRAGTMRIAAMRDLGNIEKVSESLDNLYQKLRPIKREEKIKKVIANIKDPLRIAKSNSPFLWIKNILLHDFYALINRYKAMKARHKEMIKGRRDLYAAYEQFEILQSDVIDGLEFRIFRAKYYIRQFEFNAEALRIGRIAGFQKYDEFVRRRLSSAFETITFIFSRNKEARSAFDVLFQRVQAQESNELAINSVGLVCVGATYSLSNVILNYLEEEFSAWPFLVVISLSCIPVIFAGLVWFYSRLSRHA